MSERVSQGAMRVRVVTVTVIALATMCLLQACNTHVPTHNGTSTPKAQLKSPLGVVSVTSKTAEVVTLGSSVQGASQSRRFHVAPHTEVTYVWSYPVSKAGSSFRVSLLSHFLSGSDLDELVHVGERGMEGPLGSRSWRNEGKEVDGRQVFPDVCSVKVTATQSPWSLVLLIGGHSQLKFTSSTLGFSLGYDPAICDFNEIDVDPRMAKALKVEAGRGVSVFEDRGHYGFSLISIKDHSRQSGQTELRAMTSNRPGRLSVIHPVHVGRAPGFRQVVTQGLATTVFMALSANGKDYLLVGFYDTRGSPTAYIDFSRLLGTLTFVT